MKSFNFLFALAVVTLAAISAQASTTYVCRSNVKGNVDRALFSEMTLTVDGDKVTGQLLTEEGPVAIGTETPKVALRAQITSQTADKNVVWIQFFKWRDQEELTFELRAGRVSADYYEYMDCLDEIRSTEQVTCELL